MFAPSAAGSPATPADPPRIVEVDDADGENDNADYVGLPELGGFLDTRNRSKKPLSFGGIFLYIFQRTFLQLLRLRILIFIASFVFLVT